MILWIGNLPAKLGGQNRVSYFTIRELVKLGHRIHCAGKGVQIYDEDDVPPCECTELLEDEVGKLHALIEKHKPTIIIWSHDLWNYYYIPELKAKYPEIKFVGWFTIDAHPIHRSWLPILRAMDYVCTPSQFGKDTIYARWPETQVEVIRYGIDHKQYDLSAEALSQSFALTSECDHAMDPIVRKDMRTTLDEPSGLELEFRHNKV